MQQSKTIKNIIKINLPKLEWSSSSHLDIEILISKVIDRNRTFVLSNPDHLLTQKEFNKLNELIQRRIKKEPIAYIIKEKDFYGNTFYIDKNVLIPRPETELLVDQAIKYLKNKEPLSLIDVGTGSGCIIISILKEILISIDESIENKMFIATDISEEALNVAKNNADKILFENKNLISFINTNLLENINSKFDLLVSNLPYISIEEYKNLSPEIINYEPKHSLTDKSYGYSLITNLMYQAKKKMKNNSLILLEINHSQKDILTEIAGDIFNNSKIDVIKDYANLNRILKIENY